MKMKIILFLLANLFLVNSLALTNEIGTFQNNSDIPNNETEYNSDNETDEIHRFIYEEIKGFVNEKYKETKNDIGNVRKETKNDIENMHKETKNDIANVRKETKNDIENVRKECNLVKNEIVFLNEKILKIEDYDLYKLYKGNSIFNDKTNKLHKDLKSAIDFIHDNFVSRYEFRQFWELSGLQKLIQQQERQQQNSKTTARPLQTKKSPK